MKRYRGIAFGLLIAFILLTATFWMSLAQEKPKDIAVAPKMIEVPFSASDAVEINKYRMALEDASNKINSILSNYGGGDGEFVVDKNKNWVGIRKPEVKAEKKP